MMGGKYRCSAHSDTYNSKVIESSLANGLLKLPVCSFLSKLLQKVRDWVRRLDRRRILCSKILPGYSLAWMVSSFSHSSDIMVRVLPVILATTFQLHRFGRSYIYSALLTMTASTSAQHPNEYSVLALYFDFISGIPLY